MNRHCEADHPQPFPSAAVKVARQHRIDRCQRPPRRARAVSLATVRLRTRCRVSVAESAGSDTGGVVNGQGSVATGYARPTTHSGSAIREPRGQWEGVTLVNSPMQSDAPKRILIGWGDETSGNLGVRVLGQGSRDLLRRLWPNAEYVYLNYGSKPAEIPWGWRSLLRERASRSLGMMKWLGQFDLFWDTRSGDSFADIYGLDRHLTMSLIHEFAAQAGVPAVVAPQTIGPFHGRFAAALAKRNLKRSALVFARDSASAQAADQLGRAVDLTVTDMVFGLNQPAVSRHPVDVLLNVSGLLWEQNSHVDSAKYQQSVRIILDGLLAQGREVTLLPHVIPHETDSPGKDGDVFVARTLAAEYSGKVRVHVPSSLDDARTTIASSAVLIGARMHACLNALSTGVPAVAMAYSRKFAPLMRAVDWDHVVDLTADLHPGASVLQALSTPELAQQARLTQRAGQNRLAEVLPLVAGLR